MSLGPALAAICEAPSVDAVRQAVSTWLDACAVGGQVSLLIADRGTSRLVPGASPARALEAAARGTPVDGPVGPAWESWFPLRGLRGPVGVLGVEVPGAELPPEVADGLTGLVPVVAMAVDRVLGHVERAVFREAVSLVARSRGVAVVIASEQAELLLYSDEMAALTGFGAEEVRARGFFDCVYPDPAQRARAVVSTRETFAGNPAVDVPWWVSRKDGTVVPCRLHSTRVVGPDQRRYLVATFVDRTTDEQRAVETHQAELGRFAAAVNHDFNNLLAVVQGHAEILGEHPDPGVHEPARQIVAISLRATRLTRQLAAFGRDQPLFRVPADLGPLCDDVLRQFRQGRPHAPLVQSAAPDLPAVELDPAAVKHLLLNLLDNAAESAGPDGRVSVDLARVDPPPAPSRGTSRGSVGGWVRLRVADDGPGFTPEARRKLFEPFYTTKGVGHGLGLSAVARLAEGLDAVVDVPHQVGRGAIVDVYLPVAARPPVPRATQEDPAVGGDEVIWLVDDDAAVLEVIALGLESFGYRVRPFGDAAEVLAAVDGGERVDLLISDLVMPGLDGVALYQGLRARGNPCAVLFVSGFAGTGARVPQEPKTDFVQKPVSARVLAEKARRLLNYVVPA